MRCGSVRLIRENGGLAPPVSYRFVIEYTSSRKTRTVIVNLKPQRSPSVYTRREYHRRDSTTNDQCVLVTLSNRPAW